MDRTIICPADQTVECESDIVVGTPTIISSCGLNTTITHVGPTLVSGTANCSGSNYEIVYTVVDACGRTASCTQTFTIHNDGPTIVCPADQTVECVSHIIIGTPTVTSSCYLGTTVTTTGPHLVYGQNNCPGAKYEIIYTVTDECGRIARCIQIFTIHNNGPTIVCPADQTVECASHIIVGTPTITSSCGLHTTLTTTGPALVSGIANCHGAVYSIIYNVEDACGRTASCTQTFTIHNNGPTIVCPADQTVECISDIIVGTPTVSSSCGLHTTVTHAGPTLISGKENCDGAKYEIIYTVTDGCGRIASCTQTFTLHNDGPTIVCPADQTVECFYHIDPGVPTVLTSCGLSYTTRYSAPILISGQANCPGAVYEITYTVEDACGRSTSCWQFFTIHNEGPTISCPSDVSVECADDIEIINPNVSTSCNLSYSISHFGPTLVSGKENCDGAIYEVVYTVLDDCGRSASCTQRFTIMNHPPVLVCPPDEIVECVSHIKMNTPHITTPCGISTIVTTTGPTLVSGQAGCSGAKYEITYSVVDDCGRFVSCTQTFTIHNDPPTIVCPIDVTLSHIDDFIPGIPTTTVSCLLSYTLSESGPTLVSGNDCDGAVYIYTYSITDECGRTASCDQYIYTNPKSLQCTTSNSKTTCGLNNGSATVNAFGGSGGYSYLWSTGSTNQIISGLNSGLYSVVVTDSERCTTSCNVHISNTSSPTCNISGTDTSCGLYNGSATVLAINGSGGYSYLWSTGATSATISNLVPGTYSVIVTDSEHCTTSCSVTIHESSAPTCSINGRDTSCGFNNGSATVVTGGGSGSYTYLWNTGATTSTISGLNSGTYSVVVTDSYGCITNCSVYIAGSSSPTCSIMGTDASCGFSNGSASVAVTGGFPPYAYLWNTGETSSSIINKASGVYSVVITDSKGCHTNCSVNIAPSSSPSCTIWGTDTSCGLNNGSATVFGIGGSGSYSYLWNTGAISSTINNLSAGFYSVVVTDSNGCTSSCNINIGHSSAPSCEITHVNTSCGENNGSATVHASGGVAPYTFLWSNGASSATISNLVSGVYSVVVTDYTGCSTSCTITIGTSNSPSCTINGTDTTCGLANGSATVFASGGTGPYSYLWSTGATTQSIFGLSGGTYSVVVTDSKECITSCTVFIGTSNNPTCTISGTDTTCRLANGSATVFASGGSGSYSYLWSTGSTTSTISNLLPGTYSVVVTDGSGCSTSCTITIGHSNTPTCTISGSNTTCGHANGSATVFASGGSGSYSYLWSNGATTSTISNLLPGTYSVVITDGSGCSTSCTVTIAHSSAPSCTISSTDSTCGLYNGTATVIASGGSGSYSYAWSTGHTTQTITGLGAGTYSVLITDSHGCKTSCSVIVGNSSSPTCHISSSDASCGLPNGSATVSASGGSGTYSYLWNNGSTTSTISGLSAGTYSVVVTDSHGCTTTCSVHIGSTSSPACSISSSSTTCGHSNGSATVVASGGSGVYSYLWSNGATSSTISGLAAGTYNVVVTDSNGCATNCNVMVHNSTAPTCNVSGTQITCGLANGTATAFASGGTGPYTYLWNNGSTSSTISGLSSGAYSVVVTDAHGCTTTCNTFISGSSAPTCSISSSNASCGHANGSATVVASGGSGSYTYLWSNGGNTSTITGLTAGTYSVVITDTHGCSSSCSAVVGSTSAPTCSISSTYATCGHANGSATVVASGGSGSYSYLWSNGGTTATITGLAGGTYSVVITDSNGCSTSCHVTVGSSGAPYCSISSSDATCGVANGSATVSASGGSGSYNYLWSNGGTTATITGLSAGSYSVVVTDSHGCTTSCNVLVGSTSAPTCTITSTNASCGHANGSATVVASGGSGSYTYLWSNGSTFSTITGLTAGTYSVAITDSHGCTTSCSVVVGSSSTPSCTISSIPASCSLANGSATVVASGGNGSYSYLWSNGATSSIATGLVAGNYSVVITDSNGCSTSCTVVVGNTSPPTCVINGIDATCGLHNGTATAVASGGSGGYSYLWSNGATSTSITGLTAGLYSVVITDSNGCATNCSVHIGSTSAPTCTISSTNANCGYSNGTATAVASGGNGSYSYLWNNGGTTATISGLSAGTYSVVITDSHGCSTSCSVVVGSSSTPTCSISSTIAACGVANGTATVVGSGGSGSYTYIWSNGGTTATIIGLVAGTYNVVLTDSNGCSSTVVLMSAVRVHQHAVFQVQTPRVDR